MLSRAYEWRLQATFAESSLARRGAVVATISVSADADSDNGAAFHCTPGHGRSYDRAVQRVGAGGHVPR
jgi:hypothetical protein